MNLFLTRWKSRDPKTEAHGYDPSPGKPRGMIEPDFSIVRKHFITAFTPGPWKPGSIAKRLYHIVMGSLESLPLLGPGLIKSEQIASSFFETTPTLIRTELPYNTKILPPEDFPRPLPDLASCLQQFGFVVIPQADRFAVSYQNTEREKLILSEQGWQIRGEKGILCLHREQILKVSFLGALFLSDKPTYETIVPPGLLVLNKNLPLFDQRGNPLPKNQYPDLITVLKRLGFTKEKETESDLVISLLNTEEKTLERTEGGWSLQDRGIELCSISIDNQRISLSPAGILSVIKHPKYKISENLKICLNGGEQFPRIMGLTGKDCLTRIGFIQNPDKTFGFLNTDNAKCLKEDYRWNVIDRDGKTLCLCTTDVINLSWRGIRRLGLPLQDFSSTVPKDCHGTKAFEANIEGARVKFSYVGGGNYGRVYRSSLREGRKIIMKIIPDHTDFSAIEAMNEYYLQEKAAMVGTSIVKTLSIGWSLSQFSEEKAIRSQLFICILMEDAGESNLFEKIKNPQELAPLNDYSTSEGKLRLITLISIFQQLFKGCEELATAGIVHRDLKPENLFCNTKNILKIGDFGFATEEQFQPKDGWGTIEYMAPETLLLIESRDPMIPHQTSATDIYAAGLIVHECITGDIPYNPQKSVDARRVNMQIRTTQEITMRSDTYTSRKIPITISQLLTNLVNGCWKRTPGERLTGSDGVKILHKIEQELIKWNN